MRESRGSALRELRVQWLVHLSQELTFHLLTPTLFSSYAHTCQLFPLPPSSPMQSQAWGSGPEGEAPGLRGSLLAPR